MEKSYDQFDNSYPVLILAGRGADCQSALQDIKKPAPKRNGLSWFGATKSNFIR
jgi:hypothetical protein